jgi:glycosyltransferase involved in cell wall biosynthesis
VELIRVASQHEIPARLPREKSLVVTQTALDAPVAQAVAGRHALCGFVHMPLYQRDPAGYRHYHLLLPVSRHVLDSLRGRDNAYTEPIYAVADPQRGAPGGAILERSAYDWDKRKLRDRLLGLTEPLWRAGRPATQFNKRSGLTLGIVSRLTPIKQFPLMFGILGPVIAGHPQVNLEIFGSGGYASVRDLRASLAPLREQVRFWGYQQDVARIYSQLDFVLSGLPEKEALGLNLIEAQFCGTPILAVDAPPFTETVIENETGFLFTDPRVDKGAAFATLLERLLGGAVRPDPRRATAHLERFSVAAFRNRVAAALAVAGAVARARR